MKPINSLLILKEVVIKKYIGVSMKLNVLLFTVAIVMLPVQNFAHAQIVNKQFPEEGLTYQQGKDTGFDQYKTKSLFGTKKIVLTFDDGPDAVETPRLLAILKKYNVKATFFMLSERFNAKTMPIIKQVISEGHTIASHHHDHENNNSKTEAQYRDGLRESILKVAKVLEEVDAPNREIYYRFPYGAYGSKSLSYHHFNIMKEVSQELFGDNCINFAFWDIDSLDWLKPMDEKDIISNIMANIEGGTAYNMVKGRWSGKSKKEKYTISRPMGGGVVLMHDIHARSVDTVETLLKAFKQKGVEVVPLNEVSEYSYKGKECRLKN
jgi:peptidoglycan/xylan/chitin deacetylase (PgdA/CDA1 family)